VHILLVNKAPIPVFAYGGTERVIWDLGKALSQLGHTVSYLVPQGSSCPFARVIHIDPSLAIESQVPQDVDLVHFHSAPSFPELLNKPWLTTQHGNSIKGEQLPLNTVFVSRNHAQRHFAQCYVHNGLDWDAYGKPNLDRPDAYLHFLGKAAWRVKNVKGSIDVALGARKRLKVLVGNRLNIKRGFRFTIYPSISFYGMVGGEVKINLLRDSAGLVFPVRWHEPFGLAVIESLYFGAPVFSTPYGALPEIVGSENGFLSYRSQDLVDAINHFVPNRKINHQLAQDCFNAKRMALDYLQKYETVLSGSTLNAQQPRMNDDAVALPWV